MNFKLQTSNCKITVKDQSVKTKLFGIFKLIFGIYFVVCSLPFGFPAEAASPVDKENNPEFREAFRIKIWNSPGGSIEVSLNEGKTWEAVGSVIYPAEKTNTAGYTASRWVADGKVAATAVNAIHVKTTNDAKTDDGVIFSLLPKEFLKKPRNYNSYLSPDSSIYTDIPAGEKIFGGQYSPFVGNMLLVSQPARPVIPLPKGYVPKIGDKIYILVDQPIDYPKEMVFENRLGGAVSIQYFNGGEKVIGKVISPVTGVGRFDGTKYASAGRIRANHAGVIDVSTSPLGAIGGFQIVPEKHGANMGVIKEVSQWMVVGPKNDGDPPLEGRAPFFKYFIKPNYGNNDLEEEEWEKRLLERTLVEVKLKGSDKWQPMPIYEFDEYDLTGGIPSWAGKALSKVAYFRILLPVVH